MLARIVHIPDDKAALNCGRTRRMDDPARGEIASIARKAG
jgi:hypothetical protein